MPHNIEQITGGKTRSGKGRGRSLCVGSGRMTAVEAILHHFYRRNRYSLGIYSSVSYIGESVYVTSLRLLKCDEKCVFKKE